VSHMSMFTSRLPHRSSRALHAEYAIPFDESPAEPGEPTLASVLQRNGWLTTAFTGGGAVHWSAGFDHGFASYSCRDEDDTAETLQASVDEWLQVRGDSPFFLFLHTYQIHAPYGPPPPYNRAFIRDSPTSLWIDPMVLLKSADDVCADIADGVRDDMIAQYDGDIRYTDDELVGPLIEQLQELGLYDDTMLIITSDHGEEFGEHGCWTHGSDLYEETMHVPLIIKYPHGRHAGTQVIGLVDLMDIQPTILAEMGIQQDASRIDGEDLADVISGSGRTRRGSREAVGMRFTTARADSARSVVIEEFYLRRGPDKLIVTEYEATPDGGTRLPAPVLELYDLKRDRGEMHDDAAGRVRRRDRLLARARAIYNPDLLLGDVGQILQDEGDLAWKRHLFELGYVDEEP
jgi:arylsulfatase A-like enzyme